LEQIKEFIAYDEKYHQSKSKETEKYLNELKKIAKSDFLNEFIMEEKNRVMIVPDTIKLDYEGYKCFSPLNNRTRL